MTAGNLRNIRFELMNVRLVRIQCFEVLRNACIACKLNRGQKRVSANKIAREIRIESHGIDRALREICEHILIVSLLVRAAILSLQYEAGTEGMHPARSVVLPRSVARRNSLIGKTS